MSSPVDDEGVPQRRRLLVDHGAISEILYDTLHAGAYDAHSTGNAFRGIWSGFPTWYRFLQPPAISPSTIVVSPGDGGTDAELIEAARDGLWIQEIGWSSPDPVSGAFGGEIRLGYRIRDGKLAEPIRGGTVGGFVFAPAGSPSLLSRLQAIGSTSRFVEPVSSPPVLIRELPVGGEL